MDELNRLNKIKRLNNKISETTLEEILEIAEHQRFITQPQVLIFASVIKKYVGDKKQSFIERYAEIQNNGNWREDCYGI